MGQSTHHQPQCQFRRHTGIDLAQRAHAGIQAQQAGQQQRHVRQGQYPQRARQRQQHQQQARLPTRSRVEFARRHPRQQPRDQERRPCAALASLVP